MECISVGVFLLLPDSAVVCESLPSVNAGLEIVMHYNPLNYGNTFLKTYTISGKLT
jgi:hypothetical protein